MSGFGGYGRGGRGARLLEVLNNPARRPGEQSPTIPAQQQQRVQPPAPVGRGALMMAQLQAAQGRGAGVQSTPQVTPQPPPTQVPTVQSTPALQGATAPPPPAPTVPVGRAALLKRAMEARPLGRGVPSGLAVHQHQQQRVPGAQASVESASRPPSQPPAEGHQASSPPQPHQAPPASVREGERGQGEGRERFSRLEYGLKMLDINSDAVIRRGTSGKEIMVSANSIRLQSRNEGVYQYAVSYNPAIDSMKMRQALLMPHINERSPARAFDGAILFLPVKLDNESVFESKRLTDDVMVKMRVKLVKVVPHTGCIPVYNVILRRIMTQLNMCQVGRHHYDPNRPPTIEQHNLEVWPGYVTSIQEHEGGLMLQTDVSHRVMRTDTVLDIMRNIHSRNRGGFKDEVAKLLIGCTVLTRYNNKTYRVDDIDWTMSPQSKFMKGTEEISFSQYYLNAYNKRIEDLNQCLLVHRPRKKDLPRGQKPRGGELEMVCLVPELCFMTGLTDQMRADFRVMKDLASHTRVSPTERQNSLRKFILNINSHPEARKELEKWGLCLEPDTIQIPARQLPREGVMLKNSRVDPGQEADWGRALSKEQVLRAVPMDHWLLIHTNRDKGKAIEFVQTMTQVTRQIGMHCNQPTMVELPNDRTESFIKAITTNLHEKVSVVVMIFPTSRDDRYNAVKKLCNVDAPVPSQVIISKTISQKQKLRSVVLKIALQINCKMGGELWRVEIPFRSLMVCGIDVYHDGKGSTKTSWAGLVCSINKECTRWYSRVVKQGARDQELIDGLKMNFIKALEKFHEVNHEWPQKIVVFRDGVGDGAIGTVTEHEVRQLAGCFHNFKDYNPEFAVIIVQKRINTRIFGLAERGLVNPQPGTIVDHTITRKSFYDFFIVSQHVRQGTVSPTHYIVVHDSGGWKVDHLQRLTYKMTHLYYNWPGTVRVPAPCQYAHKLAYQVGQNIRKAPSELLADRLFFL